MINTIRVFNAYIFVVLQFIFIGDCVSGMAGAIYIKGVAVTKYKR